MSLSGPPVAGEAGSFSGFSLPAPSPETPTHSKEALPFTHDDDGGEEEHED